MSYQVVILLKNRFRMLQKPLTADELLPLTAWLLVQASPPAMVRARGPSFFNFFLRFIVLWVYSPPCGWMMVLAKSPRNRNRQFGSRPGRWKSADMKIHWLCDTRLGIYIGESSVAIACSATGRLPVSAAKEMEQAASRGGWMPTLDLLGHAAKAALLITLHNNNE